MSEDSPNLIDAINRMNSNLETLVEQKKEKKFSPPWRSRINKSKVKKGWVVVLKINENNEIQFEKVPIDEQVAMVDGAPRLFTPQEMLTYKGKPWVILPSWSIKPFSSTDNFEAARMGDYMAKGYKLLMNKMLKEQIQTKKTVSPMVVIGIIAILAGIGYFAYKGGYLS